MFSNIVSKSLAVIYLFLGVSLYGEFVEMFQWNTYLANQWFIVTNVFMALVVFCSFCSIIALGMVYCEIDAEAKRFKVQMYTLLSDNLYSSFWYILPFIITVVCFQLAMYLFAGGFLIIGLCVLAFYLLHKNIIKKATITALK
ncbi:putative membrane protein [Erwinia phage pEa_SNUABM_50]|uniref:Putative membrane protein n=3 Tax=Eneladusvirus BF TaxID=2560751 RepID=A0A7L8ZPL6_9CAUD|nr:putative membrane protein [Erwinia phage pEa_SNUABM_12]QOI71969.1 putative membrane protein [Erwinia phage pEa_SNUABM_47]QOI72509.1 putative membrane protein [Erwinia phage pEa_SNUABM_50]QXO11640.1 hypothetical protein pEaSNUABM19_00529 [Erwinia phage pEa_SNUABM_19]